jgi:uncharacterized membrane protein YeaQ/YmgE (transglycosylase-associated protein family)
VDNTLAFYFWYVACNRTLGPTASIISGEVSAYTSWDSHMRHRIIAGWLTGKLMKGSGFGVFVDMIVGLIGALIGGFISSHLGFGGVSDHGLIVSTLIAVVGAVIVTLILRLITGSRSANL